MLSRIGSKDRRQLDLLLYVSLERVASFFRGPFICAAKCKQMVFPAQVECMSLGGREVCSTPVHFATCAVSFGSGLSGGTSWAHLTNEFPETIESEGLLLLVQIICRSLRHI